MADHGYDVADPRDVDPLFGGIGALERLIEAAHARGHQDHHGPGAQPHQLDSIRGSRRRSRRAPAARSGNATSSATARARTGIHPPNNWVSVFGGPAWTRVVEPDGNLGQWYLHLFDAEQPDLNWENPEVFDDLEKTLRFWLERGVDGFRIDVAHGMAKPPGLPDMRNPDLEMLTLDDDDPRFNHDGVHGSTAASGRYSTTTRPRSRSARSGSSTMRTSPSICDPTSFTSGSTSAWCVRSSTPPTSGRPSKTPSAAAELAGSPATWRLSNHDVEREVSRYGGGSVGLARAKAMALVMLALPGPVFVYNGEELGLPNVDLPDEVLQDPVWERSSHAERGRDGCRVPMPWEGSAPPFGFSTDDDTWLPMPRRVGVADGRGAGERRRINPGIVSPGDRIAPCPCGIRRQHRVARRARGCAGVPRCRWLGVRPEHRRHGDCATRRRRGGLERCAVRRGAAAQHRRLAQVASRRSPAAFRNA